MSEKSSNRGKPKTPVDKAGELARQIWLAGVGAYGQAFDETQEKVTKRVARVSEETTKLFDDLVSRGNDLEQRLGELGTLGKMGAEVGAEKLRRSADMSLSLEDRLSRMRDMLGLAPTGQIAEDKLDRMQADIAALHAKVDALIAAQDKAPKRKTSSKKPSAKKAASKKTAKKKTPTRKKSAAKKTAKQA
jgi:poly(hydroxyalkanoate) granule associated protein phasin